MGAGVGWERTLLRLSLNERSSIHSVLAEGVDRPGLSGLDARTHALVSLGALVALDAPPTSYDCAVDAALAAGATPDDIVGVLIAVGPTVGLARSSPPRRSSPVRSATTSTRPSRKATTP